ncbi:cupin domain-containing protein [Variovorax sp. N23]|uniref:cupin domain-containing protein n=1 Tax=Variovorax sp. N23 TaxID=2980555 RepID=UPI0021C865CB|nr:cupin domain-containing protein [Variovorax sp. N23]MCU4119031.1 cupin domain-containing protein [Variovorax sp. N23]
MVVDDDLDTETLQGLGDRLRKLRAERHMTLAALSVRSQISVGMLSNIERGKTSPSLKTLDRLRIALGVPLASFFDTDAGQSQERAVVTRAHQRSTLLFSESGLTKELLSPAGHRELEMLILSIEPGGSSGADPWRRVGEKCGMVLQGKFELQVGEQRYVLDEGDSFQFDSAQPHRFTNVAPGTTRVMWIIKSEEAG